MVSIKQYLTELFQTTINKLFAIDVDPLIQGASRPEYGDYQANFALRLAKTLQQKPLDIATQVINELTPHPALQQLEASGPGFINITLTNHFLADNLQSLLADPRLGVANANNQETVVIDYGGANVAKAMHVGHLRSAIIGDAIVRILRFLGHHVIPQNHLGDWGTQFGMLIEYLSETGWQAEEPHNYHDLNTLYQQAKHRFDSDPPFADRARKRVVSLQSGDPYTRHIWQQLVTESKHHFQKVYDSLQVLLTEQDICSESFYNDQLAPMINELTELGIAEQSEGALVIFIDGFVDPDGKPLPLLIRKKDGGYLYATTDLAAVKYRLHTLGGQRLIYVVDARQKQHFAMVFAAAAKAGWVKANHRFEHVSYGAVLDENHKPFKTRSGEAIQLTDLLTEAKKRATAIALEKNPSLTVTEQQPISEAIGIGALKYADLRNDKVKDYVFSWEKMLAFDGNTAPYLQNAYVRIRAIFRKGQIEATMLSQTQLQLISPIEHILAIKLATFAEIIHTVASDLALHRLCEYLYDLASTFHRFYELCPVLNDNNPIIRNSRLCLCDLTARCLKLGLTLLGIRVVEAM